MENPIVTYKCDCDKSTLKLLMITEKDYIKSYNNIVDLQNELCNEAYTRNVLLAKHLLGNNLDIIIQPKDLNVWVNTADTEREFVEIKYIRITPNANDDVMDDVVFKFISKDGEYTLDEMDYDIQIDLNNVLECCVKTLYNKLNEK